MIKAFQELNSLERKTLFEFVRRLAPTRFPDEALMEKAYGGVVYDRGKSQFSAWEDGQVTGSVALVTKEIEARGEAFLHQVLSEQQKAFAALLEHALSVCPGKISLKLGLPPEREDLGAIARAHDFSDAYSLLEMTYSAHDWEPVEPLALEPLRPENSKVFQTILNAAFLHSPNGGQLTDEEIEGLLDESSPRGLALWKGEAIGVYELSGKEDESWIDTLGVHPAFQGKGLGKALLKAVLEQCPPATKLTVMSTNHAAVQLYRSHGFGQERVLSVWMEKQLGVR